MACATPFACVIPCIVSAPRSKLGNVTINGAIESFEIERKYEVSDDAQLPDAVGFAALGLQPGAPETHELQMCIRDRPDAVGFAALGLQPGAPETHELRASYFDTPSGELASRRLALRNRHGGKDAGWHLKAKGDDGARELLWPQSDELPVGLRAEVEDRLGSGSIDRLGAIATLRTTLSLIHI